MNVVIPDLFKSWERPGVLSIRGYCQTDFFRCGVAAGWTAVKYINPMAEFYKFDRMCAPNSIWGVSPEKLTRAIRGQDLSVLRRRLNLFEIRKAIQDGFVPITSIETGCDEWHWVAIYGEENGYILYSGRIFPGFSRKSMEWKEFKSISDGIALIVSG